MRNIKEKVVTNYMKNNNLTMHLQRAVKTLKKLVQNEEIVICQSDKDSKIIVLNYSDYIKIIEKELNTYKEIKYKNKKKAEEDIQFTKKQIDELVKKLYYLDAIDENILYHTTGHKKTKTNLIQGNSESLNKIT